MRIKLLFYLFILLQSPLFAYHLTGKIDNLKDNYIFLYDNFENRYIDTAKVIEGSFVFEGKLKYPLYVSVFAGYPLRYFFLEDSEMTITGNVKDSHSFQVLGSKSEDEWEKARTIWESTKANAPQDVAQKSKVYVTFFQDYIQKHSNSSVTGLLLFQFANTTLNSEQKEILWNDLSKEERKNPYARSFHRILEIERQFIGEKIHTGKLIDIEGKAISLENYEGKYILLDFWASWCKPCRSQNLALQPIYQQFHPEKLEIISISWDRDSLLLHEAIQKDAITWTIIWQKDAKASPLSKKYAIPYIPFNFLIDKKGRIVGKNVSLEELKSVIN